MIIVKLLYFFLPIAMANMAPVLFKKYFKFLAVPIDCGKKIRGREIFGSHKTWRGFILAIISGGILYLAQYCLALNFASFNNLPFDYSKLSWWFGFIFAFAAILGDLVKSFFKRLVNIAPGHDWVPFDQLDFLVLPAILVKLYFVFPWWYFLLIISFGFILHILVNKIGILLKIRR